MGGGRECDVLFDDDVAEEDLGVSEEDVEESVTDLHRGTQHDGHVLETHLVPLLLHKMVASLSHIT